ITFAAIAQRYAIRTGFLPQSARYRKGLELMTPERMLVLGIMLTTIGLGGLGWSLSVWARTDFGPLDYPLALRILVISTTAVAVGIQLALTAFFASLLEIRTYDREPR